HWSVTGTVTGVALVMVVGLTGVLSAPAEPATATRPPDSTRRHTLTDSSATPALVAGVDTHSQTHTVAILTATGQVVSTETFTADGAGYGKIAAMLGSAGNITAVGVEGTGSYGAGLTRDLTAAGYDV